MADIALNYYIVVRKARQAELPPWLVRKMLVNNAVSAGVGLVPLAGDVMLAVRPSLSSFFLTMSSFLTSAPSSLPSNRHIKLILATQPSLKNIFVSEATSSSKPQPDDKKIQKLYTLEQVLSQVKSFQGRRVQLGFGAEGMARESLPFKLLDGGICYLCQIHISDSSCVLSFSFQSLVSIDVFYLTIPLLYPPTSIAPNGPLC